MNTTLEAPSTTTARPPAQTNLRISIATALEDLKIGLKRIRRATTDVDGFQQFIHEAQLLC